MSKDNANSIDDNQQNFIFPASTGLISFRDAGYKDTSMALAELIDNSIQANAKKIRVLAFEETDYSGTRNTKQVKKLAVFDNGIGMSPSVMQICLGFAQGTRLNNREGIGRFGVGLPLASISQCKRVTVYSWQNNGPCYSTYLDIKEVQDNELQYTNPVVESELPSDIKKVINTFLGESGSVIVWEICDRLDLKRPETLLARMEKGFCRIYRHFLDDDDNYGIRVDIKLLTITESEIIETVLLPNDPLYLMTPNNLPGYEKEATNTELQKVIRKKIEYAPGEYSEIEIHSSILRRDIGRWPNDGEHKKIRDHYKANVGISFVRAGREIDFGVFNYFNPNELTERYWGIEVRFSPVLDELFGVTNNKQNVRGIEKLDKEERDLYDEEAIKTDYKLKLRDVLSENISALIKDAGKEIANMAPKDITESDVDWSTPGLDDSKDASEVLKPEKGKKTRTKIDSEGKSEEEIHKERIEILKANDPTLKPHELEEIAEILKQLEVGLSFGSWPGSQFMTLKGAGDTALCQINRSHPFYNDLYLKVAKENNSQESQALHLLFLAYIRAENELYNDQNILEELREKWGSHLRKFLNYKANL